MAFREAGQGCLVRGVAREPRLVRRIGVGKHQRAESGDAKRRRRLVALVGVFHQRDSNRGGLGERVQHGGQRSAAVNGQAADQVERRHGGRVAGVDLDLTSVIEQRGDEPLGQFGSRERAGAIVARLSTWSHAVAWRDGVTACRNEVKSPLASQ